MAFDKIKTALEQAAVLDFPSPTAEVCLATDASATAVGAVLQQRQSAADSWRPLGFFSKKLEAAQLSYSTFDRELFAIFAAIRHFRHQLEGRRFQIWTDHKPLTYMLSQAADNRSARQQRQISFISEFTADIRHVPGSQNLVADLLSRPPAAVPEASAVKAVTVLTASAVTGGTAGVSSSSGEVQQEGNITAAARMAPPAVDLAALAAAQVDCLEVAQMKQNQALKVEKVLLGDVELWCDVSTGRQRPLVPVQWRQAVLAAMHSVSHPGIRATRRLVSARFVWPGLAAEVATWCRSCVNCQRAKVTKQPAAPVQPIPIPGRRFSQIHVDLVGPLPASSQGYAYMLTVIDRSTRWLEAVPLATTTATAVADALVATWISRFGVPEVLVSDRGPQFTSAVWEVLCKKLGIRHCTTTAYHPQSNGMVERAHRQIKDALRARLAGAEWPLHLPWVLLGLRVAPKEQSGLSSAELVYGAPLTLPGEFLRAPEHPPSDFVQQLRRQPSLAPTVKAPTFAEVVACPSKQLMAAEMVFVRRGAVAPPLAPQYEGPYRVVNRGSKVFELEIGGNRDMVTVDRLKPYLGQPMLPEQPPRRGRPPLVSSASPW